MDNQSMMVRKRNGKLEEMSFDKILNRIRKIGQEVDIHINYQALTIKVIDQLYNDIPTTKIDELAAEQCASLSTVHPDYATLSSRIVVSNHQKNTDKCFSNTMRRLYGFTDIHGTHRPLISIEFWSFVEVNHEAMDAIICDERDYLIDYFGFKTLEKSYLYKIGSSIVERPQHMWLRVAISLHLHSHQLSGTHHQGH